MRHIFRVAVWLAVATPACAQQSSQPDKLPCEICTAPQAQGQDHVATAQDSSALPAGGPGSLAGSFVVVLRKTRSGWVKN